ncbi:hypothetical protein GmHk_09G025440 [Glycine max]|nr:hypothetical protein GmHk_09G025440 [Glycine max]
MILVSLTVGLFLNFDMLFTIKFCTPPPLRFVKQCLWREKYASHEAVQDGGFNPFSFSLTFENSIRAIIGKIEESQKIARDAVIAFRRGHVSPLKGVGPESGGKGLDGLFGV